MKRYNWEGSSDVATEMGFGEGFEESQILGE